MSYIKFVYLLIFSICIFQSHGTFSATKFQQIVINNDWEDVEIEKNDAQNVYSTLNFKKIKNSVRQRKIDGLPIVPEYSILLAGNGDSSLIDFEIVREKKINDLKVNFFRGEKCRCKETLDVAFSENRYYSDTGDFRVELFGDIRGQKILKVSVALAKQKKDGLQLTESVQLKIPVGFNIITEANVLYRDLKEKSLFITTEKFKDSVTAYTEQVQQTGRKANVETLSGTPTKEDVKAIIAKYYQQEKITNVIIVGNENIIPTFYVDTKFDSQTPSDLYYGLFGGPEDRLPDVFIARVAVENKSEAQSYFNKVKSLNGSITLNHMMGVASNEGSNPSDKEYIRQMIGELAQARGSKVTYLDQDNDSSSARTFNTKLESGVNWINYIGHGSGFSWPSFNREYYIEDLDDVSEQKKFPVLIDVACQNGRFSGEGRIGESFIYGGKEKSKIGASLYYGGSVDISWHPPAVMAVGIGKFLSNKKEVPIYQALMAGHLYLIENNSNKEDIIDNLEWYHLQGDPGLIIL